jgi:ABC-2 type transport system permease protein
MSFAAQARVIGMLARRSVYQAFRRPQYLAPIIVFPTLMLAANTGGAGSATQLPGFPEVRDFFDFQLPAAMMQASLLAGVSGGTALATDFETGFSDRLLTSPIPRWSMVVGRLAATGVLGVFSGVWFVAVGLVFGARFVGGPEGALLSVLVVALAATAFGGLGAALALKSGRASVVQGTFPLVFVVLFLSTAFFPGALMLEPAKTIAEANPLSWIADAVRAPIVFGVQGDTLLKGLGGVALVAGVSYSLSALALRSRLKAA